MASLLSWSAQTKERKNEHDHHNQADQVNQAVHVPLSTLELLFQTNAACEQKFPIEAGAR
jgi:hypothetical protein